MLTFKKLREANHKRQREWDTGSLMTAAYKGNELAGEVGEACNLIKKLERERLGIRGSRADLAHLEEELSDIVICVDLIADHYGIDLGRGIPAKFNKTSESYGLSVKLDA